MRRPLSMWMYIAAGAALIIASGVRLAVLTVVRPELGRRPRGGE